MPVYQPDRVRIAPMTAGRRHVFLVIPGESLLKLDRRNPAPLQ